MFIVPKAGYNIIIQFTGYTGATFCKSTMHISLEIDISYRLVRYRNYVFTRNRLKW